MYRIFGGTSLAGLLSRFSVVGILATVTYLVVANTIIWITRIDPAIASVTAYLAGMVVSFFGQSRFTFRVGSNTPSQFLRFAILSAVGLAVSYLSVEYAVSALGISPIWGTIITALLIPALAFFVLKHWVFPPSPTVVPGSGLGKTKHK